LQPLSGELFSYCSANIVNDAQLDVKAESFWGHDRRLAFFVIKIVNLTHSLPPTSPLQSLSAMAVQNSRRRESTI